MDQSARKDLVLVALRAHQEGNAEEGIASADRIALARAELVGVRTALLEARPRGDRWRTRRLSSAPRVAARSAAETSAPMANAMIRFGFRENITTPAAPRERE